MPFLFISSSFCFSLYLLLLLGDNCRCAMNSHLKHNWSAVSNLVRVEQINTNCLKKSLSQRINQFDCLFLSWKKRALTSGIAWSKTILFIENRHLRDFALSRKFVQWPLNSINANSHARRFYCFKCHKLVRTHKMFALFLRFSTKATHKTCNCLFPF